MKEFVEKLIARLDERFKHTRHRYIRQIGDNTRNWERIKAYQEVIKIVNQFAEEYKPCNKPSCKDCKVYDKEKHYCPKWCEVIKHTTIELAEEHNNDACEWEIVSDRDIHREYKPMCSEDGFIEITGYFDYKFCPYCGKKIKIAPYQPKGE